MNQPLSPRRLSFELLEDRSLPAFGVPWFDGTSLTLSFVPDGTDVSGAPSNLFSLMGSTTPQQTWQREVLRAYQTWAVTANLNVGLVSDGGQPMGTAGAPQEDIRFGDIRVGARSLSQPGDPNAHMAGASGFDYDSKTWAGDLLFNSQFKFGVGGTPGVQSDIYTVALHEAGHSFGLADQNTDPTSVMYAGYQGITTGLSAADVAAVRALYGARKDDAYEGAAGNGTIATAYDLTANGNKVAISADVTRVGDADVYKFTTPAASTGVTGLTINLQAAGISLLTGKVTVLDASGNPVTSAATADPFNNNLSVTLPNYQPSTAYYVKVEGAGSDVFSVGSYVLKLNYSPYTPSGTSAVTNSYYTNIEGWSHGTFATAQTLAPVQLTKANTFVMAGMLAGPTDADWYKVTPTSPTAFTGTLFAGTMITTNGLLPSVAVFNAAGQQLPTSVVENDAGSFEVQLTGATTGTTYYIRVTAADPNGPRSTGVYTLGATLSPSAPVQFNSVDSATLSSSAAVQYSTLSVAGDRLTQFSLSATGGSATAASAVRVTLYDAVTGKAVFTTVAQAGKPLSTGLVWLASGNYTVVLNAATQDGSALGAVSVALAARTLSDPIDPYITDPTSPPPPLSPITTTVPVTTPPPAPIVDPIISPFTTTSISL